MLFYCFNLVLIPTAAEHKKLMILVKIFQLKFTKENLNSFGVIIEKGYKFSNLVFFIFISKYIGLANFAAFSYVFNLLYFLSLIFESGIKQIFMRDYLLFINERKKKISTTFFSLVIITILFYLLIFLYLSIEKNVLIKSLLVILSLGYILKPLMVYKYIVEADLRMFKFNILYFPFFLLAFFTKVYIIFRFKTEIESLMILICVIITLESIIECLLLMFFVSNFNIAREELSLKVLVVQLKEAGPILLSGFMIGLYSRIDQILMRFISSPIELGLYTFSVRIIEIGYSIIGSILMSEFPQIVRGKEELFFEQITVKSINKNLKIGFFISALLFIISVFVSYVVYDDKNLAFKIIIIVLLLMFTNIFVITGTIINYYLLLKKLNKIRAYSTFIGVLINISLVFLLAPYFGAFGAVFAALISYAVAGLGYIFIFKELKELKNEIILSLKFR